MAVLFPEPGQESATARRLLELAEKASDVRTSTDSIPGAGTVSFVIPDALLDAYLKNGSAFAQAKSEVPVALDDDGVEVLDGGVQVSQDAPVTEEPARRRPGRPRKTTAASEE